MNVIDQLRREARKAKLTPYRLAKDSGVPLSAVQVWWHGGGLRFETAEKLAAVLGFQIELRRKTKGR